METYKRRKVEIVVERPRAEAVIARVAALGATGYTLIPDVVGKGHHGLRGRGEVLDVFRNVLIIVITTEDIAEKILAESKSLLANYTGIVYASDVDVVRGEHF